MAAVPKAPRAELWPYVTGVTKSRYSPRSKLPNMTQRMRLATGVVGALPWRAMTGGFTKTPCILNEDGSALRSTLPRVA